jgi:hypothetical protein
MVIPKNIYSYTYRHVTSQAPIKFPEPDNVLDTYRDQSGVWRTYAERDLDVDYATIVECARIRDVVSIGGKDRLLMKSANTYWDLMQNFTYELTHQGKLSPVGRLQRMERAARFVDTIAKTGSVLGLEQVETGLYGHTRGVTHRAGTSVVVS